MIYVALSGKTDNFVVCKRQMEPALEVYLDRDVCNLIVSYVYKALFADVLDELHFIIPRAPSGRSFRRLRRTQFGWRRNSLSGCVVGWDVWEQYAIYV